MRIDPHPRGAAPASWADLPTEPTRTRRRPSQPRRAGRARRSLKPGVRVASSLALLGSHSLHADALVRAPGPDLGDGWLVNALDADMRSLPAVRHVGVAADLPLAGRVGEPVTDLQLHREYARCGGRG